MFIGFGILFLIFLFYFAKSRLNRPKPPSDYRSAVITLERTLCYGTCPAYKLTLTGDGKVTYEGQDFVRVKGTQTDQIGLQQVKELIDEFYKINYFSLQDHYTASITDQPSTITSITVNGVSKTVDDYYGAPAKLKVLENKIDEVANSIKWIK